MNELKHGPSSTGSESGAADVDSAGREYSAGFLARLVLLSLLAVIGFDLFLHAGVLSQLYKDPGSFLLPSETAFKLIPLGYLAFAILNVMLAWLMVKIGISGLAAGFRFGLVLGLFIWGALSVGLASISTAPLHILVSWPVGQAVELGMAGAIMGAGFRSKSLKKLGLWCLVIFFAGAVLGVVIQNLLGTMDTEERGNCSTFMLKSDSTLFIGHNLDETPGFHVPGSVCVNKRGQYREGITYYELISPPDEYERLAIPFQDRPDPKIDWISKYGSVTFNSEGLDFPDGGINETGLAVFEMSLGSTENRVDEENPTIFMVLWIQYVLDNCSSIDEVIDSTRKINLQGWAWHYFVSDSRGDCAVIEMLGGDVVVHRGDDLKHPVLCNSSYSRELDRLGRHKGIKAWISDTFGKTPRFVKAARMLDRFDPDSGGDPGVYAREVLEEIAIRRWNKWSILIDVKNKSVNFHTNKNRDLRYFSLAGFDFESGPARMLDMHGGKSGDVTAEFEDYTYEKNLALTTERATHLFIDRFRGLIDNGVTPEIYARRYADYSRRIRER